MELRAARHSDFAAITGLIQSKAELFRVYPRGDYPLTVAQLEALARVRSDLTVATEQDAVIGFANLYDLEPGQAVFIGNVIIDRAFRGRGVGKTLVSHMIDRALTKYGVQEVCISVFSDNIPALLLYSHLGFRPRSVEERRDGEGRRVALLHMVLRQEAWHVP